MQSQTMVFRRLVRDFMAPPALTIDAAASIKDTVGAMTVEKASCAVVIDRQNRVVGILTEQDVTRRIAFRATPSTKVGSIMSGEVKTIGPDDYLYRGIARMRRFGHRHMPVVEKDGSVVGHLDLHAAMADMSGQTMEQIDLLTREGTLDGLRDVKAAQIELAAELFADEVPAPEIQALLTDVNNDIYRRVVDGVLAAMKEEGEGDPPAQFAVIVMGSGGRGENYLYPDQDNGFIIEDYPDEEHDRIDGWFTRAAVRMNDALDKIGLPLCKGYVMAQNPLWRKTASQWKAQIEGWQRKRDTTALRLADIFFDFKGVWGPPNLSGDLIAHVTAMMKGNHSFLREMYWDDAAHGIALGWFGRFITVQDDPEHKGKINLKHTGTVPLLDAVRLLSLRAGIAARGTLGRIDALAKAGVLDEEDRDYLDGAFRHMSMIILRQQLRDHEAGLPVGNYVSPRALTKREKDYLRDGLRAIRQFRGRVRSEFTGDVF